VTERSVVSLDLVEICVEQGGVIAIHQQVRHPKGDLDAKGLLVLDILNATIYNYLSTWTGKPRILGLGKG
jgi:hypothetical protein